MVRLTVQLCKNIFVPNKKLSVKRKYKQLDNPCEIYNKMSMKQKNLMKLLRYPNSNATLQVLGNGVPGTENCIFLSTDHVSYVFNCGEGTQRLANEYTLKLTKIEHIFVTRPTWTNIGGLPGLLLTVQETNMYKVAIHCMNNLQGFVNAAKQFLTLQTLDLSYPPVDEVQPYEDQTLRVRYVPLRKTLKKVQGGFLDVDEEDQHSSNEHGKRVVDFAAEDENLENKTKKFKANTDLMCFICELKPRKGKLMPHKCKQFGIQPGPLYALLKNGEDVTKEDGTVVFSKDVCKPESSETTFIVLECPTDDYLDSLVNHSAFSKYQDASSEEERKETHCIFHITPEDIFNSRKYQDWMKKFSSNTQHIVLNSHNTGLNSKAVHKNQCLLNLLHPEIFPLLPGFDSKDNEQVKNGNIHRGKIMHTIKLRPEVENITVPDIELDPKVYIEEVNKIADFPETLAKLKTDIDRVTTKYDIANAPEYPRLVMLGTGSSKPNKIRNTSGILLRINEDSNILLDCGEGTLGQMIRFYGNSKVDDILRNIKAIYVSHMHADHHMGLIQILQRRKMCTNSKLFLLAPLEISTWLKFYDEQFEPISESYTLVNNYDVYMYNHKVSKSFETVFYHLLNIKEINTIFVKHCKHAYGIAITLNDGKKIVYSGDTMYCKNLIDLGKDCDLLIHEATLEDKLQELAIQKTHSTMSDAIKAGRAMNAKFILLTHFSQRYSKIPVWSEESKNVGLAFDNMEMKLSQLPLLHLFYPCLKIMFTEQSEACATETHEDIQNVLKI